MCVQYELTVAQNHKKMKKNPQPIAKIRPFIDQYTWKEKFSDGTKNLETTIQSPSIRHAIVMKEKIKPAYI